MENFYNEIRAFIIGVLLFVLLFVIVATYNKCTGFS